jgi:hypothetical protein
VTPTPACPACPSGWQVPQGGDPGLCCTTDANGVIECFSQAGPPGVPNGSGSEDGGISTTPIDAGPAPTGGACDGEISADGGVGPCGCQEQVGSQTYAFNCDPSTNLCTCTINNGAPTSSFTQSNVCNDPNISQDSTALFAKCGFPQQ